MKGKVYYQSVVEKRMKNKVVGMWTKQLQSFFVLDCTIQLE